jgi:hypothetical protein
LWPGAFSQLPFPLHADTETGNISAPHRAAARTKSIAAFILHPHLPPKQYCARTASCEIYLSFYVKRHGVRRHHHSQITKQKLARAAVTCLRPEARINASRELDQRSFWRILRELLAYRGVTALAGFPQVLRP